MWISALTHYPDDTCNAQWMWVIWTGLYTYPPLAELLTNRTPLTRTVSTICPDSSLGALVLEAADEVLNRRLERGICTHSVLNPLACVHDGGVIPPAKLQPNLRC